MNALKTAVLLGLLSAILLVGGEALGGRQGLEIALVLAAVMNLTGYFFSDKIALASYSARPVTPTENSEVYGRVYPVIHGLAMRMGIPMPKLWLIPQESPNAFATGRNPNHASVAFTYGILRLMDDRELEGVIAHELGHVLHRDILISSVAATIAAAITQLAYFGMFFGGSRDDRDEGEAAHWERLFMLILGPMAAGFIQMAISRSREYSADAASAKYTGHPDYLIDALRKLETGSKRIPMDASPATAHMFIVKPFSGRSMMNLFSTHPPLEKRIERLQGMLR